MNRLTAEVQFVMALLERARLSGAIWTAVVGGTECAAEGLSVRVTMIDADHRLTVLDQYGTILIELCADRVPGLVRDLTDLISLPHATKIAGGPATADSAEETKLANLVRRLTPTAARARPQMRWRSFVHFLKPAGLEPLEGLHGARRQTLES